MRSAFLVFVLAPLLAGVSHAEIFAVDQTRGVFSTSRVSLAFLPPLIDTVDSGADKTLGTFNQSANSSVELNSINKTSATTNQASGFNLSPDTAIVGAAGAASLNTTVSDPGFSASVSNGIGISSFDWTFSVDDPTQYSLNATLDSSLLSYVLFGLLSDINVLIASSYELKDISRDVILHSDIVIDAVADGIQVMGTSTHQGILLPGTYQLTATAGANADVFEDAATQGATSFQVDLTLTTVLEPDDDNDGVPNASDNCPLTSNSSQLNTDGDTQGDACDNCPNFANSGQSDTGGIGFGSAPDGIGDDCQCGDVNGSGNVTTADALIVRRSLLVPPTATMARSDLCDVGGSPACSTADSLIMRRALLVPPTATVTQQCGPAVP